MGASHIVPELGLHPQDAEHEPVRLDENAGEVMGGCMDTCGLFLSMGRSRHITTLRNEDIGKVSECDQEYWMEISAMLMLLPWWHSHRRSGEDKAVVLFFALNLLAGTINIRTLGFAALHARGFVDLSLCELGRDIGQ